MPPVLVDSILVDGAGNPIVDGSGNPIIILAGTDPADCECCGEAEPYPYCVNATLCDTEEVALFCRRSDLVAPPEVGKIYKVGGECYTVNSVTNGPAGGACDDAGFCVGTGSTLPWSPDEGPFDDCNACLPPMYACVTVSACDDSGTFRYCLNSQTAVWPSVGEVWNTDIGCVTIEGVSEFIYETCLDIDCDGTDLGPWEDNTLAGPFSGGCEECAPPSCVEAFETTYDVSGTPIGTATTYWDLSFGASGPTVGEWYRRDMGSDYVCLQVIAVTVGACSESTLGPWEWAYTSGPMDEGSCEEAP